jgi:hypothetical protein
MFERVGGLPFPFAVNPSRPERCADGVWQTGLLPPPHDKTPSRGRWPALLHLLSYVPGDQNHHLPAERRHAGACPDHRQSRIAPHQPNFTIARVRNSLSRKSRGAKSRCWHEFRIRDVIPTRPELIYARLGPTIPQLLPITSPACAHLHFALAHAVHR